MAMIDVNGGDATYGDLGGAIKKQPVPTYNPGTVPPQNQSGGGYDGSGIGAGLPTPPWSTGGQSQMPPSGFPQDFPGAQAYPLATAAPTASAAPDPNSIANAYRQYLGRTPRVDEMQWQAGDPNWLATIQNSPEAAAYAKSGNAQYSGTNVFGGDPSTAAFEQLLNKLTTSFATPQVPAGYEQAVNQLNTYLGQLNGPVYTPQQMGILQTQATDPLMQRRDAARQQAIQRLAAQGISPSSGIAQDLLNQVDRSFDQQNTQQQGQFASQAVGLQRQNEATAAQLAPLISQFQQGQTSWQDQRNQQAATLAAIIPTLAQQRLGAANTSLNANSPSIASLLQLLGNFQQQGYNQGGAYGQGIAQLLAALFGMSQ